MIAQNPRDCASANGAWLENFRLRSRFNFRPVVLSALVGVLLTCGVPASLAEAIRPACPTGQGGIDLLGLQPGWSYARWKSERGWEDLRPFSDSTSRFRIEDGVLRLESRGDSFLIGRRFPAASQPSLAGGAYLRFVVRIGRAPRDARLQNEERDDAAFRIYASFPGEPARSLVYVWSWALPPGAWSRRGKGFWGDFRGIHRKSFGQGAPPPGWLTVEVDLRRDFQTRFPGQPLPALAGIALKSDSNHTPGGESLAWLRSACLFPTSLRDAGLAEGARIGDTVLWYR